MRFVVCCVALVALTQSLACTSVVSVSLSSLLDPELFTEELDLALGVFALARFLLQC